MNKQQQLTGLEADRESNLRNMADNVHNYFDLLETGPILAGLTACLESYVKNDLVNHVATYGKQDLDEYLRTIGVLMETIALVGLLKDNHDYNNKYCNQILDLKAKIQQANERR